MSAQSTCLFGPAAPTNLRVTVSATQTDFAWNAASGLGCVTSGYWLVLSRASDGHDFPMFVTATSATFSGPPMARFFARVYSVDDRGVLSAASPPISVDPPAPCTEPPGRPPTFTATVNQSAHFDLTLQWTLPVGGCAARQVEITAGPSGIVQYLVLSEAASTRTQYIGTTREAPPGTYYVRLRFANEYGWGPFSPEQTVVVQPRTACTLFCP